MHTKTSEEIIPLRADSDSSPSYGQETVVPELFGDKEVGLIRNVTAPALTVHRPDPARATGTAVIVCPGGSFVTLTHGTGRDIAKAIAAQGHTAFVLRYRLLPTPPRDADFLEHWATRYSIDDIKAQSYTATADGGSAVGFVRSRAADWDLDPHRVGILGSSAGGLVTVGAATTYDEAQRPDFASVLYPPTWHEYTVPADAPPLFVTFAADDPDAGVVDGNLDLYRAWRAADRPVELHAYAEGGHGFAMAARGLPCDSWLDRWHEWLGSLRLP
ncbi:alpha/beta hydrolase [Nocardia brasiliensis]|uniref:alpha/beta hydrolase n=1 Tax=Nocardia brasiliensis TaxID=37326 RepID=UPI003D8D2274